MGHSGKNQRQNPSRQFLSALLELCIRRQVRPSLREHVPARRHIQKPEEPQTLRQGLPTYRALFAAAQFWFPPLKHLAHIPAEVIHLEQELVSAC